MEKFSSRPQNAEVLKYGLNKGITEIKISEGLKFSLISYFNFKIALNIKIQKILIKNVKSFKKKMSLEKKITFATIR